MKQEKFLSVLMLKLIESHNSGVYHLPGVLDVYRRLVMNIREGIYSRHSKPIVETCKELGIKNDRETIDELFNPETERKSL